MRKWERHRCVSVYDSSAKLQDSDVSAEADRLSDFQPARQQHWVEKCVFYQVLRRTTAQWNCARRQNNEAKRGAINFSLCRAFGRRDAGDRQGWMSPCSFARRSALLCGFVKLNSEEVTWVQAERGCPCRQPKEEDLGILHCRGWGSRSHFVVGGK